MTIDVTTHSPSDPSFPLSDDSFPTSVTSCKTGTTSITLPAASLAANTAMVCTFKVRVRASHVADKKLPTIRVQATNGSIPVDVISTVPANNELSGLSVYTRPSLVISADLADGEFFSLMRAAKHEDTTIPLYLSTRRNMWQHLQPATLIISCCLLTPEVVAVPLQPSSMLVF